MRDFYGGELSMSIPTGKRFDTLTITMRSKDGKLRTLSFPIKDKSDAKKLLRSLQLSTKAHIVEKWLTYHHANRDQ
jgi:hypothetical protein